jgi:hypothetical protein
VHVLDPIDRVDAGQRRAERVLDAARRTVCPVEQLP